MEKAKEDILKRYYSTISDKVDALQKSLAMVVQVVPGPRLECFGSGFFYEKNGTSFFITAAHVLRDIKKYRDSGRASFLITRGEKEVIPLLGLEFFCTDELDIAIASLERLAPSDYSHIRLIKHSEVAFDRVLSEKNFYCFTGFLASQNKTYTGQLIKPQQRIITISLSKNNEPSSPFIYFEFDPRNLLDSELKKLSTSWPEGMSGGPVFEMRGPVENQVAVLVGMGVACTTEQPRLKVLRFDVIDAWLSQYPTWLLADA